MAADMCLRKCGRVATLYTLYCDDCWGLLAAPRREHIRRWYRDTYGPHRTREAMQVELRCQPRFGIRWARNA